MQSLTYENNLIDYHWVSWTKLLCIISWNWHFTASYLDLRYPTIDKVKLLDVICMAYVNSPNGRMVLFNFILSSSIVNHIQPNSQEKYQYVLGQKFWTIEHKISRMVQKFNHILHLTTEAVYKYRSKFQSQ